MYWQVKGTYNDQIFCECEHCLGHGVAKRKIDTIVQATDAIAAEILALDCYNCDWEDPDDRAERWHDDLLIRECPADVLMHHLGQSALPGLG